LKNEPASKGCFDMSELIIEPVGKDWDQLQEREGRIERAQRNAYYEIGLELKVIRDSGLYKQGRERPIAGKYSFTTFEEYCQDRWDMSYDRAHDLIKNAEIAQKLENLPGFVPTRESHVRELLKLDDDGHRAEVWKRVVASGETVTAKVVEDEVTRFKNELDKDWYTLDEWNAIPEHDRSELFYLSDKKMNKQDSTSIEWAQWSWNPITGCKHDCPYCYARDIANRFYKQKFDPSIYPVRFSAPANTSVPAQAETDVAFKNVFTGSMADIFGRWVPDEWVRRVIDIVRDCPQWNFLFLTKFPQRVHEYESNLPVNAWMGTTVDCQDRVANAERAFAKMTGGTKWLSIEPMLTPLRFERLDLFDWIVIGGASPSSKTPKWVPPFDWISDLHQQARDSGCKIYHKDNLGMGDDLRLREFPWSDSAKTELPDALKYLGIK
jgi:protein gp37